MHTEDVEALAAHTAAQLKLWQRAAAKAALPWPGSAQCARPVTWKKAVLGAPQAVLAVPTSAVTAAKALAQVLAARRAGAQVVELRLDLLAADCRLNPRRAEEAAGRLLPVIAKAAAALRGSGCGLLLTVRTAREGGAFALAAPVYVQLLRALLAAISQNQLAPLVDALDVEASCGALSALTHEAREVGIDVVASAHFLHPTSVDHLVNCLQQMQTDGAAVAKIAVLAPDADAVTELVHASVCARQFLQIPLIAIAMGRAGVATRLGGSEFGSALTFATVSGAASAPGQLPLSVLVRARECLAQLNEPGITAAQAGV